MKAPIVVTHIAPLVPAVLVVLSSLGGCRESRDLSGIPETRFVAVMADLKRVHDANGVDSARRAFQRDSILQSRGLTAARLREAAEELAENPARAQTIWQAIQRRANATNAVRVTPPGAAAVAPPPATSK